MAVRATLARLVAVLAIAAGIVLLQGSLCDGGVATAAPCVACPVAGPMSVTVVDAFASQPGGDEAAVDVTGSTDDRGGLIELCLTVLLAVLFAVVGLRRPGAFVSPPTTGQARTGRSVRLRAPRLEQLCVLRT